MSKNPETIVLHGGDYRRDPATTAVAVPIYRTTSYQFNDTGHAANLFALKEFGNIYTRIMNPTNDVLEKRVAALEGGLAALTVGSGQAASTFAIMNVCQSGDNFISSTDLYGGTVNLFTHTLKKLGIECRYADPADPKNFEKLIDDKTRCFYAETLPNPYLRVFPIKEVADIGKKHNIPLIMDNTASPVICKPIEHGAAVVVHSLTKFIGGHGTTIGGITPGPMSATRFIEDYDCSTSDITDNGNTDDRIHQACINKLVETNNTQDSNISTNTSNISSNDNDTTLPTSAAVKDYVDTNVTAQDLDIQGDSGTGAVDLDSQSLDIAGGSNVTTAASGQTLTVNLDSTLTGLTSVTSTGFTGDLTGDVTGNQLDASWLILFQTDGEKYTVTNRGLRYISLGKKNPNKIFYIIKLNRSIVFFILINMLIKHMA